MAIRIRLRRIGRRKHPAYRIVTANAGAPRDGKFIEDLGYYNPMFSNDDPKRLFINLERLQYWVERGAEKTERVGILEKKMADRQQQAAEQ